MLLAAPLALLWAYSTVSDFDDEGTLMITLHDLMQGRRLYDDVFALYGPFYYLTVGSIFTLFHAPLTHDAVRLVSVIFQILDSAALAWASFRLVPSRLGGLFTFVMGVQLLRFLPLSPTHPQEMGLLLLVALPALMAWAERRERRANIAFVLIGIILAGLTLTKINLGAFASLAVALTVVGLTKRGPFVTAGMVALSVATIVLPIVLMVPLFDQGWVKGYLVFSACIVVASVMVWLRGPRATWMTLRHWAVLCAAFVATAVVIIGLGMFVFGSTPSPMLEAILLQNARLIHNWWFPIDLEPWAYGLAAVAATIAIVATYPPTPQVALAARTMCARAKLFAGSVTVAGALFVVLQAAELGRPVTFQSLPYVFQLLMPASFLLLVPSDPKQTVGAGRACHAMLATLMVLYPFPVAGTQLVIASVLMIAAAPVLLLEGIAGAMDRAPSLAGPYRARAAIAAIMSVAFALGLAGQTRRAWWSWGGRPALDLPGSRFVHGPPATVAEVKWAVDQLSKCDSFYTMPGMMSFYFWTGRPSPTSLNNNDALGLLSEDQQTKVVSSLRARTGLCILESPQLFTLFDRGQIAARPPLLRYIQDDFEQVASKGSYALLVRKGERDADQTSARPGADPNPPEPRR